MSCDQLLRLGTPISYTGCLMLVLIARQFIAESYL